MLVTGEVSNDRGRSFLTPWGSAMTLNLDSIAVIVIPNTRHLEHAVPGAFNSALWLLTLSASLSGLLFGYDTGVISSTLISLGDSFSRPLTTWDKSAITSSTSLLALVFSPLAGHFADTIGRRPVIGVASLLFVVGALLQAFATRVWVMVAGRSVVGVAVGLASAITPLYIGEISPAEKRGQLVTVQSLFITGGQVVAYLVGWAVQGKWRWAVGVGALPALLQALLIMGMQESPRWLVMKGREEEAKKVLESLGESSRKTDRLIKSIRAEVLEEDALSGKKGLKQSLYALLTVPRNRRALTIACMLQGLQQLCGFNSLMYFSATIFSLVGFTSPIGTSLSIALTNFILTLVAFAVIDRIGRRRILLASIPFMILGLAACAVAFLHIDADGGHEARPAGRAGASSSVWPNALLASLILYVAAYAVGLGCVPWQQSELFPLSARSLGSGLATTTNWTTNCLTAASFLPMMQSLGPSLTFSCYAVICAVGWCAVFGFYPETSGLALEDVGNLLADGWGVWGVKVNSREEEESTID
ncbi:general substrate transporter [Delphinella strobiligena]|nr:general substrate transporter [Delphinella strobiligena]